MSVARNMENGVLIRALDIIAEKAPDRYVAEILREAGWRIARFHGVMPTDVSKSLPINIAPNPEKVNDFIKHIVHPFDGGNVGGNGLQLLHIL